MRRENFSPSTLAFLARCRAAFDAREREEPPPRPSPCPEIEARLRALAEAPPVEVEADSGPVSRRSGEVAIDLEILAYCGAV